MNRQDILDWINGKSQLPTSYTNRISDTQKATGCAFTKNNSNALATSFSINDLVNDDDKIFVQTIAEFVIHVKNKFDQMITSKNITFDDDDEYNYQFAKFITQFLKLKYKSTAKLDIPVLQAFLNSAFNHNLYTSLGLTPIMDVSMLNKCKVQTLRLLMQDKNIEQELIIAAQDKNKNPIKLVHEMLKDIIARPYLIEDTKNNQQLANLITESLQSETPDFVLDNTLVSELWSKLPNHAQERILGHDLINHITLARNLSNGQNTKDLLKTLQTQTNEPAIPITFDL